MKSDASYRKNLIAAVEQYADPLRREESIRERFLQLLNTVPYPADRGSLPAHLTASAWVVHTALASCLLIFHKKLGIWIQAGGHADGSFNLVEVAKREVLEETGVSVSAVFDESIFDLDIHDIPAGKNTPAHQHFDVRYLFRAEEGAQLAPNEEVHAVRWVPFDEVEKYTLEPSILRMRDRSKALLFLDKPS
jgi:8-oxo-dGTP pyrophosphatase MutT (NUDIX family)